MMLPGGSGPGADAEWVFAGKVSDQLVAVLNTAIEDLEFDALRLLAGFLSALHTLLGTTYPLDEALRVAAEDCLVAIVKHGGRR
jgi:hypothetical protein